MCLGVPGRVVEIVSEDFQLATVDVEGVRRNVHIGLLSADGGVQVGDWVLIHVGFALSRIDEEEARAAIGFLRGMGQAYEDELDALRESRPA
jgi:hydrogenase expression/formation protein HypC